MLYFNNPEQLCPYFGKKWEMKNTFLSSESYLDS
jgi:hypothetical protein